MQDEVKLHVRQLQKECKETNEKLKALYAKNGTTSKKDMTEKEKNRHKTLEKRQTSLLKKLRSLKRKLRKYEKLEYVVRDKGTFVNSSGLSEEYTVVTVKGLVSNSVGTEQSCSKFDQETVKTHYDQSNLANSKKTFSLKESKGKKMLKKSSELDKGKVKPLGSSNSKIKTAKQKLAAKKILKIKKAKTRQILKESAGKKKLKLKHAVNKESESDSPAGKGVSTVTAEVVKKRGRGRPKKGEEKNPGKLKVNSLPNITKTGKKTKAIAQLKQARKEKEQQEVKEILIAAYHGERGAKLAAQQKISAYNESLSLDSAAKGEN